MRFKTLFYEGVTPQAKAYWISPTGETIPVIMTHIDTVLKSPDRFGLSHDYINKVADENGGVGELRDGGKARDVIMTDMLKNGWGRIRKVTKPYEFWTIQIENLSRTVKRNIIKWVEEMYKMNEHRLKDTVVVLDTKGNKLFGGGTNFKDQKTLKDIYLDDTGVFESVFNDETIINESSLSRVWQHNEKHDCGALTAFRKSEDCGEGRKYSYKENIARNKSLLAKLQAKGYGVTALRGIYPEGGKQTTERSFFVVDLNDTGNLFNDLKSLGELFQQDSILFAPKGSIKGENKAYLYGTNHCEDNWLGYGNKQTFDTAKMGYESPIYTSFVNGRPFIFESVDKIHYQPQNGMGVWSLHIASKKPWESFIDD